MDFTTPLSLGYGLAERKPYDDSEFNTSCVKPILAGDKKYSVLFKREKLYTVEVVLC